MGEKKVNRLMDCFNSPFRAETVNKDLEGQDEDGRPGAVSASALARDVDLEALDAAE